MKIGDLVRDAFAHDGRIGIITSNIRTATKQDRVRFCLMDDTIEVVDVVFSGEYDLCIPGDLDVVSTIK